MPILYNSINTFSKDQQVQRTILGQQLELIEAEAEDTKEFSDNGKFNRDLAMATGFSGTLSMKGFKLIVEKVADEVGGTLNEFGHVEHNSIVKAEYGVLLRTIIYTLVFSYGTAYAQTYMINRAGAKHRTEVHELARGFAERLIFKKQKSQRKHPKESILQMVVRKEMGTKVLFGSIKQALTGFITDHFRQVEAGLQPNIFKRLRLLEECDGDDHISGPSFAPESEDIWDQFDHKEGVAYAQQMLLWAIDQLTEDQKHVLRSLFTADPKMFESRVTFRTQAAAIYKRTGFSKRKVMELANEIVSSIRESLGITVFERSVSTLVPVHCSRAVMLKRKTVLPASFEVEYKSRREDFFESSLLEEAHLDDLLMAMRWSANSTSEVIIAKLLREKEVTKGEANDGSTQGMD